MEPTYETKVVNTETNAKTNRVTYHVQFTKGEDKNFVVPFEVSLYTPFEQVLPLIADRIKEYETSDSIKATVPTGILDLSSTEKDEQEINQLQARQDWTSKRAKRNYLRSLIAEGFLEGSKLSAVQMEIDRLGSEINDATDPSILG